MALLGTAIGSANNSVASVALPGVLDDFPGTSVSSGTWLIVGYILATAVAMPIAGRMIDFWGTRRISASAFLLFAVASALCATADSFPQLMIGRALQGVAGGPVLPTVFLTVSACFPRERQGRPLGIWAAVNGASLAAAPLVGGAIIAAWGWRSIFWIDVPGALLVFWAMQRFLPDLGGKVQGRFDVAGAALFASSLLGLMLVLSRASAWGWRSPALQVSALVTVLTLGAYVASALRSDNPFFDLRLFRQRAYVAVTAIASLQMAALFGVFFAVPLLAVNHLGYSTPVAGALIALTPLVATVTAPLAGGVTDRFGFRLPLTLGGALLCGGGVLLGVGAQGSALLLAIALGVVGLGVGFITSPSAAGATHSAAGRSGVAMGAFNTARFTSGVAGATLFTLIFERVARIPSGGVLGDAAAGLAPAFRVVFWGIAAAGAAVILVAILLLPPVTDDPDRDGRRSPGSPGTPRRDSPRGSGGRPGPGHRPPPGAPVA